MRNKLQFAPSLRPAVDYRNEHIVWFGSGRTYLNATVDGILRSCFMGTHELDEIRGWCERRGIPLEVGTGTPEVTCASEV